MTACYWALSFVLLSLVALLGVPLLGMWIERRAKERDAEVWAQMPGATR